MNPNKLQEGVLCLLKMGRWDARVKLDKKLLPKSIPKEIVSARQDMVLDRKDLDNLATIRRSAKRVLFQHSLPFPIDGVMWVDRENIPHIEEQFELFKEQYKECLQQLCNNLGSMKNKFKKKYPEYYEAVKHNYPSNDQLKHKFYFNWQFFQITVPDKSTKILSPKQYKKETEKLKNMVKQMEEMTLNMIGNMLMKRVQTLSKQCDSDKINAGTIHSFERFFKKWDELWSGHVDEKKLRFILTRLRKEMKGIDKETLNANTKVREKLSTTLESAIAKIKNIPNFQLKPKLDI